MLDFDPFVPAKPILAALGGKSRRTLYDMVKRGDFPAPDRPAQRRGEADLWRESSVRRGLEQFARAGSKPEQRGAAAA